MQEQSCGSGHHLLFWFHYCIFMLVITVFKAFGIWFQPSTLCSLLRQNLTWWTRFFHKHHDAGAIFSSSPLILLYSREGKSRSHSQSQGQRSNSGIKGVFTIIKVWWRWIDFHSKFNYFTFSGFNCILN